MKDMSRLGSASSPAAVCPCAPSVKRDILLRAFWLKPDSAFGLLLMTTFISSSHSLTNTTQPGTPSASTLADNATLSRACRRSMNGYVVPVASHQVVTNPACTGRLRLTEQSVPLPGEPRWNNPSRDFTSH
jgi:hypothetical protein